MDNEVISVAASTDIAESYNDDEFINGFSDALGINSEEKTDGFEVEDESGIRGPIGDTGPEGPQGIPGETGPETEKETEEAESPEKEAESEPEMISFKEAGKEFSAPKEAVEAFAKAVGRDAASLIDIYQKGCNFDKLNGKLNEALKDSEALEKLAAMRKLNKNALREELLATLEKTEFDGVVAQIKRESPGIGEETARELAKFRLEQAKPKEEPAKKEEPDSEHHLARLREVEIFQAKHPELGTLPNEVIELWEKSGIDLETAFKGYQNKTRVTELEKELAEMKTKQKKDEQKAYAKNTSPGSATSAAGNPAVDPFVEGLFAKY
jgi:hypothetical protein